MCAGASILVCFLQRKSILRVSLCDEVERQLKAKAGSKVKTNAGCGQFLFLNSFWWWVARRAHTPTRTRPRVAEGAVCGRVWRARHVARRRKSVGGVPG